MLWRFRCGARTGVQSESIGDTGVAGGVDDVSGGILAMLKIRPTRRLAVVRVVSVPDERASFLGRHGKNRTEEIMKSDIHPEYVVATVHCSCGNTFVTRSTKADLHIELCNECHPFYTGRQKLVDTGGRVERFQRRYGDRSKNRAQ